MSASTSGLNATNHETAESSSLTELPEPSENLLEFADEALAYIQENGKERALEEFSNETGQFVAGDRYVIAFGFDGTCLAHPWRSEMVGENKIDLRDANGILLNRNMNKIASRGGGFTYYVRPNAQQNNSLELKLSYIAKVDDEWWIGTGIWLSNVPAVFSAESRLSLVMLVDEAVAYAEVNGKEKALEGFGDKNGDFVDGDLYVFAYDFNNTVLAHPIQPELVGKDRSEDLDPYGVAIGCDIMEVAKDGTGLVYYTYPEPEKNMTPTIKLGYVRAVDDDWWLGSGIYVNKADQAEDGASSFSEPAASKEELASFVEAAASYAQVFGRDLAIKDFMDLEGPFVRGDVYIFAHDFNGTSLALPRLPSAVGTNRLDLQNSEGVYINRDMRAIAENGSGFFEYLWTNPISGETEPKTSYVTKVDDGWWLGAGIYLKGEEKATGA